MLGRTRIHRRDATDLGPKPAGDGAAFDIAFIDPPYGQGLGERALAELARGGWLAPRALVVFERGKAEPEPKTPGYQRLDARDYGAGRVLFLKASPASE
jgi:16S rRNA (guanine966-N2)-methyltransferase